MKFLPTKCPRTKVIYFKINYLAYDYYIFIDYFKLLFRMAAVKIGENFYDKK